MIRRLARATALSAAALDVAAAWSLWSGGASVVRLRWAATATALALVPCAISFALTAARAVRRRGVRVVPIRLPIEVPRGFVGAAVLGGVAALTTMGQRFGNFVFLGGVSLIALALSQARVRGDRTSRLR